MTDLKRSTVLAMQRRAMRRGLLSPNMGQARLFPLPTVMASPPTFTEGTNNGSPTIASFKSYQETDAALRYFGTTPIPYSTGTWYSRDPLTTYWAVDFETDAPVLEIQTLALQAPAAARYRMIVDGQYTAQTPRTQKTGSGQQFYLKVDFGSRTPRHIHFEMDYNFIFGGIYVGPLDSVWRSRTPMGGKLVVFGDSFVEGTAIHSAMEGFAVEGGKLLGYRWIRTAGYGGTGYINPNVDAGRVPFIDRVSDDISAYSPDLVIVCGGYNDVGYNPGSGLVTGAQIGAAAGLVAAAIREENPGCTLVMMSNQSVSGFPTATQIAARDAMRVAVAPYANLFVDTIVSPTSGQNALGWRVGSGHVSAETGGGNADIYTGSGVTAQLPQGDAVHSSIAGDAYDARRLAGEIAAYLDTV